MSAASAQLAGKLIAATAEFLQPLRDKFAVVLRIVSQAHGIPTEQIMGEGKGRSTMAARRVAVTLAVEFLHPPLDAEAIGGWLNLSRSSVYRTLSHTSARAEADEVFRQHLETLRTQIREALNQESSNGQR